MAARRRVAEEKKRRHQRSELSLENSVVCTSRCCPALPPFLEKSVVKKNTVPQRGSESRPCQGPYCFLPRPPRPGPGRTPPGHQRPAAVRTRHSLLPGRGRTRSPLSDPPQSRGGLPSRVPHSTDPPVSPGLRGAGTVQIHREAVGRQWLDRRMWPAHTPTTPLPRPGTLLKNYKRKSPTSCSLRETSVEKESACGGNQSRRSFWSDSGAEAPWF